MLECVCVYVYINELYHFVFKQKKKNSLLYFAVKKICSIRIIIFFLSLFLILFSIGLRVFFSRICITMIIITIL